MKIHPVGLEAVILKKSPNKYKTVFLYISGEIKQKCPPVHYWREIMPSRPWESFSSPIMHWWVFLFWKLPPARFGVMSELETMYRDIKCRKDIAL